MKKILFVLFTIVGFNGYSQEWTKYEFDKNLTLEIPTDFEIIDTLGQHFVRAVTDDGVVVVQRLENTEMKATSISDKNALISAYEEFTKGIADAHHAQILKQESREVKGILTSEISMRANINGQLQMIYLTVVFLNNNWYAIQFWEYAVEMGDLTDATESFRNKLFHSIEFPAGATEQNQLTESGSPEYKFGYAFGTIITFLLIMLVIAGVMFVMFGRRRKKDPTDVM